jgi:hypothetical protein
MLEGVCAGPHQAGMWWIEANQSADGAISFI